MKSSLPDEEITLHYIHDNYSCKLLHNRKESNTNIEHIPTAIQADIMLTEKEGSTYHGEILPYHPPQGERGRRENAELASKEIELWLGNSFGQ